MRVPSWLPALLGYLSACGPISTDMYLPAFPAIAETFGSGPGSVQITLAAWFAGLAIGQITQGILADRFGRRRPLMISTALYAAASAGCALAPSLGWLTIFRGLSAFGGAASSVIPRAIVRDVAEGHAAARMMAKLILVFGVAPIIAPTLGGIVLGLADWRAIFWITGAYGAIGCILVAFFLPDTFPPERRVRLDATMILVRFGGIVRDRVFASHAGIAAFAMFGLFAYIAGSPVVIGLYGISPQLFGLMFGLASIGYVAGAQIGPRLMHRYGAGRVLRTAVRAYLVAALALLFTASTGFGGLAGFALPVLAAVTSMGFVMPNASIGALSRHAAHAGSASALIGTLQFALAACGGLAVGTLSDGTARPLAALMCAGAIAANLADRWRTR